MNRDQAHAKINLYLHVTGRRPDGYHELDSLAVFASSHDVISATEDIAGSDAVGHDTLQITGPFSRGLCNTADNLVSRSAALLRRVPGCETRRPINITLAKNLPIASGIGGGSADAAASLRVIAKLWGVDTALLPPIASEIGADVPVCLAQRPMRMRGIGADLDYAPILPQFNMLLVNPGLAVSTPEVFKRFQAVESPFRQEAVLPKAWNHLDDMVETLNNTRNDLQPIAEEICPTITQVLHVISRQPGCAFTRMSGSGATCFGLFQDSTAARAAATECRNLGWWADAGRVLS